MKHKHQFLNATVVFPDRIELVDSVLIDRGRIVSINEAHDHDANVTDLKGYYLTPGFIDLHVHGGGGADFMDLTEDAFRTVCQTHARHGTTSLTPTSTVAPEAESGRFLELCKSFRDRATGGASIVGAHHYGPYFSPEARGCHPTNGFLVPDKDHLKGFDGFDESFPLSVTIAPELASSEEMMRACTELGIHVNIGHSYATMEQVESAVRSGARHVDHLYCAMSDRARLRQKQTFPMRAGVMEATLYCEELTTEVIADGKHLNDALLRLAFKIKGPDRLALVTDAMRAVDLPDGEYWFGGKDSGERVRRLNDVGVTLDGLALASGVMGLDHCVRVMKQATQAPLHEIIRMVTQTPARIIGLDHSIGSIKVGLRADLLVLNQQLEIQHVYIDGIPL